MFTTGLLMSAQPIQDDIYIYLISTVSILAMAASTLGYPLVTWVSDSEMEITKNTVKSGPDQDRIQARSGHI